MPNINTTTDVPPALPTGIMLGNYYILKVIEMDVFAIIYLAQNKDTNKLVVIKENFPATITVRNKNSLMVSPVDKSQEEAYDNALTRFLDEARTLSRLNHPNIVPIRKAFKALGTAYYVMPHVEGAMLSEAAPDPDSITAEWLLPVLEKILSALNHIHSQGFIHRDIKPYNILLRTDGEPILIDFSAVCTLDNTRPCIGTHGFMPLEQYRTGRKCGPWTDMFALGTTCYKLITGELPPDYFARLGGYEYLPLAGRASLAKRFPEHVLSGIDKALRMKIDERWQSAQEWMDSLKAQH